MTDVWKIGQNMDASEFYKTPQYGGVLLANSEIYCANRLRDVCNEMAATYDQIIQDQNDYLAEIEVSLGDIAQLENDLEAQIKQIEAEIEELLIKKENGTITPEEEAELAAKRGELATLEGQTNSKISAKNNDIANVYQKSTAEGYKSKATIATNYGEVALEKGQPLSETKDKRKSFWRKAFGGWDKSKEREAGKQLLEAGNNLLENVNTSKSIDSEITKKTKNSVQK